MVWAFIKGFEIPYCKLYDEGKVLNSLGYTYLGNKGNTVKNEELYDSENHIYKSASIASGSMEQKSRAKKTKL